MLTKLTIRNFKRFGEIEVELGNPVLFFGPNNSGKTSAMQALALWDIGVKRWNEQRAGRNGPETHLGVTINRKDLFAIPNPNARHLWRDLQIHGQTRANNVRIDLVVEGINEGKLWKCGLEFDYANEEAFYCRPLRTDERQHPDSPPVPEHAGAVRIAYLPSMSGLVANETRIDQGALNVRVGEGRTAEILRNLCFRVASQSADKWGSLVQRIEKLFGATLYEPRYVEERGEIAMEYRERGFTFDLSASGRGLQQTLLILAYMHVNPRAVILLDEPDAHLEILRQRQIYGLINEVASESGTQIVAASHSEILLNEAAGKDLVISFVGKPHRIDGGTSQVRKALVGVGFDQYCQAEQTGWVLYLEGSTDLAILQAFARKLGKHAASLALEQPFISYVGDQPPKVARHFHGLREALPELKGVALFDRLDRELPNDPSLAYLIWKRREIENYLCTRSTLKAYARASAAASEPESLLADTEIDRRLTAMDEAIEEVSKALETLGRESPWGDNVKASEDFLIPLFKSYFAKIGIPNLMAKKNFHELAAYVPVDEIASEVGEKLDAIAGVAESVARASNE